MTAGRLQQAHASFASAIELAGSYIRVENVKLSGRAVRQPGSSNDPAIGRFEHNGDVLAFGKSLVDLERGSRPLPDRADRSDDVRLFQRSTTILSAADRCRMVMVKANE